MTESLVIKSVNSDASLEISVRAENGEPRRLDYLNVSIRSTDLRAEARIYNFHYAQGTGTLAKFFAELAKSWRGWEGEKVWESIEGDFKLTCTHDPLGHIFVEALLRSGIGGNNYWRVVCGLVLEAGQLDAVAAQLERFLTIEQGA